MVANEVWGQSEVVAILLYIQQKLIDTCIYIVYIYLAKAKSCMAISESFSHKCDWLCSLLYCIMLVQKGGQETMPITLILGQWPSFKAL